MHFPFRHKIKINGVMITTLIGRLVIEADHSDPNSIGRPPEWTVDEIELLGLRDEAPWAGDHKPNFSDEWVALPDTHFLHDRLLVDLINEYRKGIDVAWAAHLAEKQAIARKGFKLATSVANEI